MSNYRALSVVRIRLRDTTVILRICLKSSSQKPNELYNNTHMEFLYMISISYCVLLFYFLGCYVENDTKGNGTKRR